MPAINVKNAAGDTESLEKPNVNGRAAAASSRPVALSGEDKDVLDAILNALAEGLDYELVAASDTDEPLGTTGGAIGDVLIELLVIPATTSPGLVQIQDGAGTAITVFAGGASSIGSLHPFTIPLGIPSVAGAWSITTGANVSVLAKGRFT